MRKILAASLLAGASVTALTAAPASAECLEVGYHRVIQVTPTIFVEAPKSVDPDPADCITTLLAVVGGGN